MKRYEDTKFSGLDWLGEIPAHWEVKKLKQLAENVQTGFTPPTEEKKYYDDGTIYWFAPSDFGDHVLLQDAKKKITPLAVETGNARYFKPNSVLLVGIGATLGKVGISEMACSANQQINAISFKENYDPYFATYYLKSINHIIVSSANASTMPILNQSDTKDLYCVCPPLPEQRAIAAYLDRKTAQLDTLLAQKEALLQKLHQKRQALINEAVTQGLNPAAPRKPSGVAWLGDVPAHWEVRKITRAFSKIGSGTTPEAGLDKYYQNGTINWVNTGDLNDGILESCQKKVTELALKECSALKVYPAGTILVAMYGATIGKTSLMQFEACTNQACCALTAGPALNDKFALYWFLANKPHIISLGYGGGQPNISQDTIRQLRMQTPPMEEQEAIVAYLDSKTNQINEAAATIHTQIQTLKAYRQSLISEVVTGKVDVRPAPAPEADLPLWLQ